MTQKKNLRKTLEAGTFFVAPGIQDMITAIVANKVGFDFAYGSGYWSIASAYGLPDAGVATYTEMVDRRRILAETSSSTIIADADTGYGGLLNIRRTVQGYEQAGVSGIQLEDQVTPKRCGHTRNKQVVPSEDMEQKIRVACESRRDPENTVIIARTDAVAVEGFDAAMRRAEKYVEAGAEVLFVEALTDEEQMHKACAALDVPMMANMADGGNTPILDAKTLEEIGYAFAIFPAMCSLHAAAAVEQALSSLKETGTSLKSGLPMFDFPEFCDRIGFEEVYELDAKWAKMNS